MSQMGAKLVTGGILAVLGLALLKFVLGMFAFVFFLVVKILPFVLIGMVVIWLFRRLTRNGGTSSSTTP